MGPNTAFLMSIVCFAVFAYVMYWVIRASVRAGVRDALRGARLSGDGRMSFEDSERGSPR
ncbi:hypothetical protein [Bogoriella caseilytica]|uniref:Uncharacterized protein n=1 Tax=Bogoriella caseilytica TaxID=56055 RepID=A0A3N2BGT2_9MICO|nr:hypothetical protein [Bogoriella caseilytica]ROR74435.1 hypothetical protein EDD31_2851 [Bogoriella caseilytica]